MRQVSLDLRGRCRVPEILYVVRILFVGLVTGRQEITERQERRVLSIVIRDRISAEGLHVLESSSPWGKDS